MPSTPNLLFLETRSTLEEILAGLKTTEHLQPTEQAVAQQLSKQITRIKDRIETTTNEELMLPPIDIVNNPTAYFFRSVTEILSRLKNAIEEWLGLSSTQRSTPEMRLRNIYTSIHRLTIQLNGFIFKTQELDYARQISTLEDTKEKAQDYLEKAQNSLKQTKKMEKEAKISVASVGSAQQSKLYDHYAKKNRQGYWVFRSVALGFMIAMGCCFYWFLSDIQKNTGESWALVLLFRLGMPLLFLIPITWAIKLAAQYFTLCKVNEQKSLEIRNLNAYLRNIDHDDMRDSIKVVLAFRYFGNLDGHDIRVEEIAKNLLSRPELKP